jgi:hypothetical protein
MGETAEFLEQLFHDMSTPWGTVARNWLRRWEGRPPLRTGHPSPGFWRLRQA